MTSPLELVSELITSFRDDRPRSNAGVIARKRAGLRPIGPDVSVSSSGATTSNLLSVLRRRRSLRFFGPQGLPAGDVSEVVLAALQTDAAAWPDDHRCCPFEIFAIVVRLDGLEPGMYRLDPGSGSYTPLAALPPEAELEDLTIQSEFCRSAVILSVAGDLDLATQLYGTHGYRTMMTRASAVAYTMWLRAVGREWIGSVFAGFIPAAVRIPLSSDGNSRHQLFALALGAPPANAAALPESGIESSSNTGEEEKHV